MVTIAALTLAGGGVSAVTLGLGGSSGRSDAARRDTRPAATSEITRSDLAASQALAGELGYGTPVPVHGRLPGTVTWLPEQGAVVQRGEALYKVDNQPVALMYGATPMYRDLARGVEGPDVEQLNDNLRALGYGAPNGDVFTAETAAAVRALQQKQGVKATGTLKIGQLHFARDAVRVAEHRTVVGDTASATVLTRTSRSKTVTVQVDVGDQELAKKGKVVKVLLPGGSSVEGKIRRVRTVTSGEGEKSDGKDGSVKTKIDVEIEIADQHALKGLDTATVDVEFTSATAKNALSVPVTALVALADGGYAVRVVDGDRTRTVPVKLALFAQGRVEIESRELRAGMKVAVPK
ncbi:peptidoglycan-binding protein [Streptomyces sp. TRM66268-LWL]|uniref:Peptidoglycan-binding protein n=1 Tax=Streptomyces polyasparticus TaxID=2767826 RepID=A0ABR7SXG8_9ACTN|nr:peptidoglycan-binding protein [Streptomyces polyasparticus]MBC9719579.1 peptidoglycan-binding protein [Streptomyces polyasparticus]